MAQPGMTRTHVLVSGKVQGVWFRESTRQEAERLGVGGWVRNLPDGRVEAVFTGPAAAVDAMVAWCHRGPPAAQVAGVAATPHDGPDEAGFRVLR
jgi:acylphosphatase